MNLTQLMQTLTKSQIRLSSSDEGLKVSAERGSLTPEIREGIRKHKDELLQRLREAEGETLALPMLTPDPAGDFIPFPMSDLQSAFYLADDPFMEFHVRPHYYLERNFTGLDLARYQAAWNKAVSRHRREFVLVNDQGRLFLPAETPKVEIKVNVLKEEEASGIEAQLMRIRERLMRRELPLDRWPIFDLEVSMWSEGPIQKARVHYNNNNFFFDGFGSNLFMAEVERNYAEPSLELPPIPISFRDAVLGLAVVAESALGQAARRYWEDRLPALPPPPPLPQIPGLNRRCRSRLKRRELVLPPYVWTSFKAQASRNGVTPSNAVIAVYTEIVAAFSDTRHFILSNMMTRRLPIHANIKDILGNFATLYPLEVDLRETTAFGDGARRLQAQVLRDANHRHWGGMAVMGALNRLRGEAGGAPCPFVVGSGIFMEGFPKFDYSCLETSQTMLDNQFWELTDGSLYVVWDLLEEFFPAGLIDSMWKATENLILRLAAEPEAWNQAPLQVVPESDLAARARVNRTGRPVPEGMLHGALPFHAERTPSKPFWSGAAGDLGYRDLDEWSRSIAAALRSRGVRRGECVAIAADKGPALLAAVMGTLAAGGAYVPIDPSLPAERLEYLLRNSRVTTLLSDAKHAGARAWPSSASVVDVDGLRPRERGLPASGPEEFSPLDLAYVIYTSGSTGQPKGVMIDHRGALNTVLDINRRFGVDDKDVVFGVSAFNFDLSVYDIFGTLAAGATLVYPEADAGLNPAAWLDSIRNHGVTVWNSVPALMSLLVETAARQGAVMPGLRLVMLSGDWIPLDLPAAIRKVAPNAKLISMGGATEASIWSIYYEIGGTNPAWTSIPYGFPLDNQTWQIRDTLGRQAPTWTPGELYIGGIGVALGYLGDAEKTARSFITDPWTSERWYRTGDRGRYLPDGSIEFLGRIDFQVKIQGYRIELGEIEAALLEHPAVKEAVVAAVNSGSVKQLAAYVVPVPGGAAFDPQDAQAFLRGKLPGYMVPVSWVILERMPLTGNGKVDRKSLPEPSAAPAQPKREKAFAPPRSETESALVSIWEEILERKPISIEDDFFDIGGHSFGAVRILALIKERLGKSLSLGEIFQGRTIAKMAEGMSGAAKVSAPRSLVTLRAQGDGVPCFFVHPAGGHTLCYLELARRLENPVFGFQALGVDGASDPLEGIPAMAEGYVKELLEARPHGPYVLGGWSSGSMIAFEMAARLESAGEKVEKLVFFDGPPPFAHNGIAARTLLHWFIEDLALDLPAGAYASFDPEARTLRENFRLALDAAGNTRGAALDPEHLEPIFRVFRSVVVAGGQYRAPRIKADILSIKAGEGTVSEFAHHPYRGSADWGWSNFTDGKVEAHVLPGSHHTLLTAPNVDAVSREVLRHLGPERMRPRG